MKKKEIIGYDIKRERSFQASKEFKKSAFLDILSYLRGYNGINVPLDNFKTFKRSFLSAFKEYYKNDYKGLSDHRIFELFEIDFLRLEELENNFNRYTHEIDFNGHPVNEPDFNLYAENENEIITFQALENVLKSLRILKNTGRMVLIGELNNSLFGAFEIDLQSLTIKPKAEYIKNPRYSVRKGNPRLKL